MNLAALQKEHALRCEENQSTDIVQKLKLFLQPVGYKPFLILSGLFFFQQFAGTYVVLFYTVQFFKVVQLSSLLKTYLNQFLFKF